MSRPAPRITGRPLILFSTLLRSAGLGPPLQRALSAAVVDDRLAHLDFAAKGDPAPFYAPPPYKSATGATWPAALVLEAPDAQDAQTTEHGDDTREPEAR
jgi:hypothetical protein